MGRFARDNQLKELRQSEIRDQCLYFWKIPNQVRKAPPIVKPDEMVMRMFDKQTSFLRSTATEINVENLQDCFKSGVYDWKCLILGSRSHLQSSSATYQDSQERAGFFLGLGRSKVYVWNRNRWDKVGDDLKFDLSPGTLLYGEVIKEMRGEARSQRKVRLISIS